MVWYPVWSMSSFENQSDKSENIYHESGEFNTRTKTLVIRDIWEAQKHVINKIDSFKVKNIELRLNSINGLWKEFFSQFQNVENITVYKNWFGYGEMPVNTQFDCEWISGNLKLDTLGVSIPFLKNTEKLPIQGWPGWKIRRAMMVESISARWAMKSVGTEAPQKRKTDPENEPEPDTLCRNLIEACKWINDISIEPLHDMQQFEDPWISKKLDSITWGEQTPQKLRIRAHQEYFSWEKYRVLFSGGAILCQPMNLSNQWDIYWQAVGISLTENAVNKWWQIAIVNKEPLTIQVWPHLLKFNLENNTVTRISNALPEVKNDERLYDLNNGIAVVQSLNKAQFYILKNGKYKKSFAMEGFSGNADKHGGYSIKECVISWTLVTLKITGIVNNAPPWELRFRYDGQKLYSDWSTVPQTDLGILLDNWVRRESYTISITD